jgi:hypothetical protein
VLVVPKPRGNLFVSYSLSSTNGPVHNTLNMAGLEGLTSLIYHEKQQPGSMLCAQHALNSLLRQFTRFPLIITHSNVDQQKGTMSVYPCKFDASMADQVICSSQLPIFRTSRTHWTRLKKATTMPTRGVTAPIWTIQVCTCCLGSSRSSFD